MRAFDTHWISDQFSVNFPPPGVRGVVRGAGLAVLLITALLCSCSKENGAISTVLPRQVRWLGNQQAPNGSVEYPLPSRRHLVVSYELPRNDPAYRFVYAKSFVYDNAMTAIALCIAKEWERARRLLLSLCGLIRDDGSLWFNYDLKVNWPTETDHEAALVRTGAVSWAGYALTYYLRNCPDSARVASSDSAFLGSAERIASYVLGQLTIDPDDPRAGLVRGGWGEITYAIDENGKVVERFTDVPITWVSTEHNIDAHLFLSALGELADKGDYRDAAGRIEKNLLGKLWSDRHGQFWRGMRGEGRIDTVLALDCAAWGAIFAHNVQRAKVADRCLQAVERLYHNTCDTVPGYLPYHGAPVYESENVGRALLPEHPENTWGEFPFCWYEGNFFVALAFARAGKVEAADSLMSQWSRRLASDTVKGIPYASRSIPYQFSTWKSAGSTAWYVIAASELLGSSLAHSFFAIPHE